MPATNKPPVGVATTSGLMAALLQYAGAIISVLLDGPTEVAVGTLGTATVTLLTVLLGRYAQALRGTPRFTEANRLFTTQHGVTHLAAATSSHFVGPIQPRYFAEGGLVKADDTTDEGPGDADALPDLPTTSAPEKPDNDDAIHRFEPKERRR